MRRAVAVLALLGGLGGCGSPTPDFYTLAPVPGAAVSGAPQRVELRRSGLPGYLDRDELVRSASAYKVSVSGRERWAEPLGSMLDRVFTQDLSARLPGSTVFSEQSPISAAPDAVVELNIQRFDDDPDGTVVLIALLLVPPGAPLQNPETGEMFTNSPFMDSLIVTIALVFLACGTGYGIGAGTIRRADDVIAAMTKAIAGLSGLIFLLLIISQFLAQFSYTNMTTLAAVWLADVLSAANLPVVSLLVAFVLVTMVLDLIITGAIPKWAIFAPLFVPLLMRLHVAPDAVLAAYRVGDSPINSLTPLNAYFAMIVTFAQRYQKDAGVGTVIALMLPYVALMIVTWTVLLVAWQLLGLPWGF